LRGRYCGIPPVKATCCCMAIIVYSAGEGDLLLRHCLAHTAGQGKMLLLHDCFCSYTTGEGNYLRIPPLKATCCCVAVLRVPLVKATCCCVTVFACTTGEGNVLLRDCFACTTGEGNVLLRDCFACTTGESNVLLRGYLRIPLVKATRC